MLRLPISRSGVVLPAWLVSLLAGLLTVMLCFTTDVPVARAETPSPVPLSPASSARFVARSHSRSPLAFWCTTRVRAIGATPRASWSASFRALGDWPERWSPP